MLTSVFHYQVCYGIQWLPLPFAIHLAYHYIRHDQQLWLYQLQVVF